MITAPIPDNEEERLSDLGLVKILDTPPEERFDRLVQLAAHIFEVPISYVALVDSDRQWFKAKVGITAKQTARDISFCGHAILKDEPLVVLDASRDDRFFDNTLVTGETHFRFYVGQPLRGPHGHNVGTLCIVDTRPRDINDRQLETLKRISAIAEHELNLIDLIDTQQSLIQTQKELMATHERLAVELKEAGAYVHSLLPEKLQLGQIVTDYQFISSSQLGGDMLGYHWLDGKEGARLAMYLLDVSGHGVGASLLSVSVLNTIRRQTFSGVAFENPAAVLSGLNLAFPIEENHGRLITAWYGVYHPQSRLLEYASAGSPPAIVLNPSDDPKLLGHSDPVLGFDPDVKYGSDQLEIAPGTRLWLYSDGAFELRSAEGQMLGIEGLTALLAEAVAAPRGVEYVTQKLRAFQGRENFDDDLSLLEVTFE
jgi:sigma-B regulation protein RsbU (phosphoserine phosphatase)